MDLNELIDIKSPNVGSEDSAWATLRAHFAERLCHIQRFEDKLSFGIPDSNICYEGHDFWFEGKFLREYPKRGNTRVQVGLREDQRNWLNARKRAGGTCVVWVREPRGWRFVTDDFDALHDGIPLNRWENTGTLCKTSSELVEGVLAYVMLHQRSTRGIPAAATTRT